MSLEIEYYDGRTYVPVTKYDVYAKRIYIFAAKWGTLYAN